MVDYAQTSKLQEEECVLNELSQCVCSCQSALLVFLRGESYGNKEDLIFTQEKLEL